LSTNPSPLSLNSSLSSLNPPPPSLNPVSDFCFGPQHDRAGGCLHTFEEGGYEFDTGLHYVSGIKGRDSSLANIVAHMTDDAIQWQHNGDVFDVAVFCDGAS
jgi:hypothetical protein